MNLDEGIQIEDPSVIISWEVTEAELPKILIGAHRVTPGYWTIDCTAFDGLKHVLGFHFERNSGRLERLEIFFRAYSDLEASFDTVQDHLERLLGKPDVTRPTAQGYRSAEWNKGSIQAWNFILDRFGPELRSGLMKARL